MNNKARGSAKTLFKRLTSGVGLVFLVIFSFALGAGSAYGYFSLKINEIKKLFPPISEFASLIGDIVLVSPDSVTITVVNIPQTPFENLPVTRKVLIGPETPIVRLSTKYGEDYDKEVAEYTRQQTFIQCSALGRFTPVVKVSDRPLEAPFPYIEEKLDISALKPGDRILVDAGAGIKSKEEFPAARIVVQPQ